MADSRQSLWLKKVTLVHLESHFCSPGSQGHTSAATSHSWRYSHPLSETRNAAPGTLQVAKTITDHSFLLFFPGSRGGHTLIPGNESSQGLPGSRLLSEYTRLLDNQTHPAIPSSDINLQCFLCTFCSSWSVKLQWLGIKPAPHWNQKVPYQCLSNTKSVRVFSFVYLFL